MRIRVKFMIASALLALALTGCAVNASSDVSKESKLSLADVEKAFTANGLKYTEHLSPKEPDTKIAFNGVFPAASLNTEGHSVTVFIYDSEASAKKAVDEYMAPLKGVTFNGPWTMAESAQNAMFLLDIQASKEYAVIQKLKS